MPRSASGRRMLATTVATVVVVALSSCRVEPDLTPGARSDVPPQGSVGPLAPKGTSLRRIQETGVLRWGVDPAGGAPFAMPDPQDPRRLIGFEIELVEGLARHLGVRSEPVEGDWLALIDNLRSGRIDLALNGLEVSAERAAVVDFTVPYYRYGQQLTIREADRGRYGSLADLAGRRISVLNGSASVDVLRAAGWRDERIAQYDDSLAPYVELANGRVDGSLAESIIAGYYAAGIPGLYRLPETFSPGDYAGALRKGEPELRAAIDAALTRMKESGELGRIYQRWGVWTDEQAAIGIARGPEVAKRALAAPGGGGLDWGRVLRELAYATGATIGLTAVSMPLAVLAGLA
ncbi:MAG TPA: transporter substrate-binding domain-containing protein, partial [Patescibacteria group bacterium]|nr:transporter substrate-binding domain-containing protein [Patescibacteria group bacterium]